MSIDFRKIRNLGFGVQLDPFSKSDEAKADMRETLDAAESWSIPASLVAAVADVGGRAIMTPLVAAAETMCQDPVSGSFCKGLLQPLINFSRKATYFDSLETDYGFSETETRRFWENTDYVMSATGILIPVGGMATVYSRGLRISNSAQYGKWNHVFKKTPKEFHGTLSKDLTLVRFGSAYETPEQSMKWWTTPSEINKTVFDSLYLDEYELGESMHTTIARIPAGEPIKFLYGRASAKAEGIPSSLMQEGMTSYQFYDFDPRWISQTRPFVDRQTVSFPALTEHWTQDLRELSGLDIKGKLRLVEYNNQKNLIASIDDLWATDSKSTLKYFRDNTDMAKRYGADRFLIQAQFEQSAPMGYRGQELKQVLERRYGLHSIPTDLHLARYTLQQHASSFPLFYELPLSEKPLFNPTVLKQQQIPKHWLGPESNTSELHVGSYEMVRDHLGTYFSVHADGLYANGNPNVLQNIIHHMRDEISQTGANRLYLTTEFRNERLKDLLMKRYSMKHISEVNTSDNLYEIPLSVSRSTVFFPLPKDSQTKTEKKPFLYSRIGVLPLTEQTQRTHYNYLGSIKTAQEWIRAFPSMGDIRDTIYSLSPFSAKGSVDAASGLTQLIYDTVSSIFDDTRLRFAANQSQGDETVIYALPRIDETGATYIGPLHQAVLGLSKGRKLVVQRVSSSEEIAHMLQTNANISHVWLTFHGNASSLSIHPNLSMDASIASNWPIDHFTPKAQVILMSCESGLQSPERPLSLADLIYYRLRKKVSVIATKTEVNRLSPKVASDGKVSFIRKGKDVTRTISRKTEGLQKPLQNSRPRRRAAELFKSAQINLNLKPPTSHAAGDRITEMLNRHSAEAQAYKTLHKEIAELRAYLESRDERIAAEKDRSRLQGAFSAAALAAQNFKCPRLAAIFDAGYQMMKFEDAAKKVQGIKDLKSPEGISAISSVASAGLVMISVFAALDKSPSSLLGPLQEQMKMYHTHLCHKLQEICELTSHCHAEKMWEFESARHELFSAYENLKAQNGQLIKETTCLKQATTLSFARIEQNMVFLSREIDYRMQELQLESLRKIEDGINHYEFGKVAPDTIKGWAETLERWMSNPPANYVKTSFSSGTIGLIARLAKTNESLEIEDSDIESLVNLDTLESLLEAYVVVRKILQQEALIYDPKGILWEEKVMRPLEICEHIATSLNKANYTPWEEYHEEYMNQIARIRRNVEEKMKPSLEKWNKAAKELASSETLLADKMRELISALSQNQQSEA